MIQFPSSLLKQCTNCQRVLPAMTEYFRADNTLNGGLRNQCKDCVNAREKAYRSTHAEEKRVYLKEYRKSHTKEQRAYRRTHKEEYRARKHKRRAWRRNNGGSYTAVDIQRQYKAQKAKCYYCKCKLGKCYHRDHVVPLSRGGSNNIDNIVLTCPTCNLRKNNKLPHEWPEGGKLL